MRKKVSVPDGNGGWTEIEGEVHEGGQVNADKQQRALEQAFITESGRLTERLWQFLTLYAKEQGLTKEHLAFAVALLCVNMREDFPDGKEAFDRITAAAADYYDTHTK